MYTILTNRRGAQTKAKDRGAQSSARIALTTAKTLYADTGDYLGATDTGLEDVEPGLVFVLSNGTPGSSAGPKSVSVLPAAEQWYAAVLSDTGTCDYIRDSIDPVASATNVPGTSYSSTADLTDTTCIATASPATAYTSAGW